MKFKNSIYWIMAVLFLAACTEDNSVEIITLNKGGDTFYFGEKVPVWVAVEGDLHNITYDWSCSGGAFDGFRTQHLFENLWIAPTVAGEYTIDVTAKSSGKSDHRQVKMKVVNYFTEEFDLGSQNPAGWASSNTTLAYDGVSINGGPFDRYVRVPSTSNSSDAQLRRTFTGTPLTPPFSIRTKLRYTGYKTVTNVTTGNAATYFSLYFVQPTTNTDKQYIREIRLEFCPPATGTNQNWRLRMESYLPATGKSNFATAVGDNRTIPGPFLPNEIQGRNELFSFTKNEFHTFTMTIDADRNFSAYVDGNVFVNKSDAIKQFVANNNLSHFDMQVREFRLTTPRKSSASAANTEMVWEVSAVEINDKNSAINSDVNNIGFSELK